MQPGPSADDLEEAFELCDLDDNGQVDLEEFMYLYALIEAGQVTGIGKGSLNTGVSFFSNSKAKKEKVESKKEKRAKFLELMQQKRDARRSGSFKQNIVLPRDVITHDNTGISFIFLYECHSFLFFFSPPFPTILIHMFYKYTASLLYIYILSHPLSLYLSPFLHNITIPLT